MSKKSKRKPKTAIDRNDPLYELMGYHHRAVELRYEGKTYKDISGELALEYKKGIHFDTIRKWFASDGLLEQEYFDYASKENDRRRKMMQEELKKLLGKIPAKMDALIERTDDTGHPDSLALATIKTLFEVLNVTSTPIPNGDKLAEYFKRLETAKIPGEGGE